MKNEILNSVCCNVKNYIEKDKISPIMDSEIKREFESLDSGKYLKICDFAESKDDGIYLSKADTLRINIVKKSRKNFKTISDEDFKNLLIYSYTIRVLSYRENTPFDIVRSFNKQIDDIISKYL